MKLEILEHVRALFALALCAIIMQFLISPYLINASIFQTNSSNFIVYQSSANDPCSTVTKSISVNDYGLSAQGHFRILANSSLDLSPLMINETKIMAENAYSSLVNFFNATPYDQDKSGIIDILIANLNENYNRGISIAGYTIPASDPNGKSIEYIDAHYLMTSSYNDTYITIAHELFHLIQASIFNLSNHADWVIEGTAVFASDYALKGYSPLFDSISFAYDNFNVSLLTPTACLSLPAYIADYVIAPTFFEFLAEKFGLSIIPKFLHKLSTESDLKALEDVTNSSIDDLFSQFAVWNFLGLYKGTNYTFEHVKVRADPQAVLGIHSSYQNTVHALSTNYIELPNTPLLLYINYQGNLNFVIIKIKDQKGNPSYEVSYIKNENMIYISNSTNFDRIILAIVNSNTKDYNYSINVEPSNVSVITLTQAAMMSYNPIVTYLFLIILILSVVLLILIALFLYTRSSFNKVSSQGT